MGQDRDITTKEQLLQAAQALILMKGFTATSLDEVCEAAGVTKGSLFHYFKTKEDLGVAVINYFWAGQKRMVGTAAFLENEEPLERVLGMVDFFVWVMNNRSFPKSCVVGNIAQELADTNDRLRTTCAENFAWWSDFFKQELDAAALRHLPPTKRKAIDTRGLANFLIATIQGSFILVKATRRASIGANNLKHFRRYIESLFQPTLTNKERTTA